MALAEHPGRGLADHGEGLDQEVVEGLALGEALAELVGLGPQLGVGEGRRSPRPSSLIGPTSSASWRTRLPSPAWRNF